MNSWIYNYFEPCAGNADGIPRAKCMECVRHRNKHDSIYKLSKNSLAGPVGHLRTEHLIYNAADEYDSAIKALNRRKRQTEVLDSAMVA